MEIIKYHRLTFLRDLGWHKKTKNHWRHCWEMQCDCGTIREFDAHNVKGGRSKSCGCLSRETTSKRMFKHGRGQDKAGEYRIWKAMKERCYYSKSKGYPNYGGRGITVCDRWLHSFENFLADMGERPSKSHSIDRIDTDGNYCLENCRWATPIEQGNNKRRNNFYEHQGRRLTLRQWGDIVGLSYQVLRARRDLKWSVERMLTEPIKKDANRKAGQKVNIP